MLGDAIAQHGLRDRCQWRTHWSPATPFARPRGPMPSSPGSTRTRRAGPSTPGGGSCDSQVSRRPDSSAPAYAYTPALHATLPRRFAWWAGMNRLYMPDGPAQGTATGPLLAVTAVGRVRRLAAPSMIRARAALAGRMLRLDVKPSDLESRRHVAALERVLVAARGRVPVTLDEVASSAPTSRAEALRPPAPGVARRSQIECDGERLQQVVVIERGADELPGTRERSEHERAGPPAAAGRQVAPLPRPLRAARARVRAVDALGRLVGEDHDRAGVGVRRRREDRRYDALQERVRGRQPRRGPGGARRGAAVLAGARDDVGQRRRRLRSRQVGGERRQSRSRGRHRSRRR